MWNEIFRDVTPEFNSVYKKGMHETVVGPKGWSSSFLLKNLVENETSLLKMKFCEWSPLYENWSGKGDLVQHKKFTMIYYCTIQNFIFTCLNPVSDNILPSFWEIYYKLICQAPFLNFHKFALGKSMVITEEIGIIGRRNIVKGWRNCTRSLI